MAYDEATKQRILELKAQGLGSREVAKLCGVSKSGVNYLVARSLEDTVENKHVGSSIDSAYAPRILIYDIETAPSLSYHWRRWKENIGQAQVVREGYMLSWAAKWLGSDEVAFDSLRLNPGADAEDDSKILMSLVEMMKQADIIVAHNNKRFDLPTVQAYMLRHGMEPLPPMKIVDTLLIAKKNFRFASNSLASLGQYLGCGAKLQHSGFSLWRGCLEGDKESWDVMEEYNIQDVHLLEDVYMKLRAWDRQHPNVSLYYPNGVKRCPCCGSTALSRTDYLAYTGVSAFETFVCGGCGKFSRTRSNIKSKEQRDNVLSNIAQ